MVILTDAVRTIRKSRKRFFSLLLLVMLAAAFLSGLRTTSPDMKYSAAKYYKEQKLMDVRIVSTLGCSEENLEKIKALDDVKTAEGSRQTDLQLDNLVVSVISMPEKINLLYLKEGRLPDHTGECVVDSGLLDEMEVSIGDSITLKDGKKDTDTDSETSTELKDYTYKIVGIVMSPLYVSVDRGTSNVGTGTISAFIYVPEAEFDWDYYTSVYLLLNGTSDMQAYTDTYDNYTKAFVKKTKDFGQAIADERKAQLQADGETKIKDAQTKIDESQAELDKESSDGYQKLKDATAELDASKEKLALAWKNYDKMAAAYGAENAQVLALKKELDQQQTTLDDAYAKVADSKKELEEELAKAQAKIDDAKTDVADAQTELDKLDAVSYVLDRSANTGYVSYSQDSDKMADLAEVFPVIFYLVAALSCLTSMTRMIEDHRGEIGTLKALGYGNGLIAVKYIGYAFLASFIGGTIGLLWGCTAIPILAFTAWEGQYMLPALSFQLQIPMYIISVGIAVVLVTGTAYLSCRVELNARPAALMRPRAPKAGKRIFLERIGFFWNHLKFTTKVSFRNLFRYQQRFWMTVLGIMGCTALLVVGFGLYDAIYAILDKQFDEITYYDATLSLDDDISKEDFDAVDKVLTDSSVVERHTQVFSSLSDVSFKDGSKERTVSNVYLTGVKDVSAIHDYVDIRHRTDDVPVTFLQNTAKKNTAKGMVTEKMADVLGAEKGDTITVTLSDDRVVNIVISEIVENYVNNYIYMDLTDLNKICEDGVSVNEFMFTYTEDASSEEIDDLSAKLVGMEGTSSYSYIESTVERFQKSLSAVNAAVSIIIVAAAALAFVVLYNLTNINVTERIRELATLKVLGFTDRETTNYIYRENIVMTIFGIALGLWGGKYLVIWLMTTVENDYMMFGRSVTLRSYLVAAALTIGFSLFVNVIAHFSIQKIDMVESLKSVE